MATKKITELTAVTNAAGSDEFVIVQGGVTYRATRAKNASKGVDIASAATTDIGAATGEYVDIIDTVNITSFGTVAAGTKRIVRFTGILTLTYNATSLILPSSANILTAVDDIAEFISLGSGNWICTKYQRKDGNALIIGTTAITMKNKSIVEAEGAAVASTAAPYIWNADGNTIHITGTTTITAFGAAPQVGAWKKVIFDDVLILTNGANLNLQGGANITTAANDFAFVYADTTTLFRVIYFRANGSSLDIKPSFSVHKNGTNQNDIVTATWTKATWSTEEWDTNNNFASNAFTPTVAGYYNFTASGTIITPVDQTLISVAIYKNGALVKNTQTYASGTGDVSALVNATMYANGSTDYFEMYVYHTSGSNKNLYGSSSFTFFQGNKV